ncbi:MAG: multidrug efflux SMR transporter [Leptolyngbya sp. BL-A-14]
MPDYAYLLLAILSEVIGTSALKATVSFTKLVPSLVVLVGYSFAFYFLSLSLRTISIGVAYAIWSGLGIVLVAIFGWLFYRQTIDQAGLIGMGLIIAGVAVLQLYSKTVPH